jgi:hypothetical protein
MVSLLAELRCQPSCQSTKHRPLCAFLQQGIPMQHSHVRRVSRAAVVGRHFKGDTSALKVLNAQQLLRRPRSLQNNRSFADCFVCRCGNRRRVQRHDEMTRGDFAVSNDGRLYHPWHSCS